MNTWVAGNDLTKHHYQIKKLSTADKVKEQYELSMNNIDYAHAQEVWEVFKTKNFGKYDDLYVKGDTLLLADVFENFRDKCIEIYKLEPAHFVSASGLA